MNPIKRLNYLFTDLIMVCEKFHNIERAKMKISSLSIRKFKFHKHVKISFTIRKHIEEYSQEKAERDTEAQSLRRAELFMQTRENNFPKLIPFVCVPLKSEKFNAFIIIIG
jgi:hypothetical protein